MAPVKIDGFTGVVVVPSEACLRPSNGQNVGSEVVNSPPKLNDIVAVVATEFID
jgi:hypothetical protein